MLDELSARYNQLSTFKEEYPEEHRNNLDKRRSKRAKTTTIISEKRLTDKYIHHAETRVASFTLVFDEHAKLHTKHADAPSHVDAVAFARGSDHLRACNLRNLKKPRVTMPATHSSEYEIPLPLVDPGTVQDPAKILLLQERGEDSVIKAKIAKGGIDEFPPDAMFVFRHSSNWIALVATREYVILCPHKHPSKDGLQLAEGFAHHYNRQPANDTKITRSVIKLALRTTPMYKLKEDPAKDRFTSPSCNLLKGQIHYCSEVQER